MELKDFTEKEQKEVREGLSTAEISDKEAADKIIERIANQYPDLYAVARKSGELPEKEREELRRIITDIFQEKMNKHNIR